ncbi:MAG: hypothetical protein WC665_11695 [Sulfurimonas sp.]|jgi:prolyl-tRNA editing enzyme YbaK/EbsC (Cys-tRNA(Pro) deacylase)
MELTIQIESPSDYEVKEARLEEISRELSEMAKEENPSMVKTLAFRDEARALVLALKQYVKNAFETNN